MKDSIVAFCDALGTSSAAIDPKKAPEFLDKLVRAYDKVKHRTEVEIPIDNIRVNWFSDNVAISGEITEPFSIVKVINFVGWLQACFALEGIFLRGGISRGLHYHRDNIDYGPALVEAVNLEKLGSSDSVRIVLSKSLQKQIDLTSFNGSDTIPFLARDKVDTSIFIDFLRFIRPTVDSVHLWKKIESGMAELPNDQKSGRVRAKYFWLSKYYEWSFTREISGESASTATHFERLFEGA